MSKGKIPQTSDPLLRALLDSGRARIHTVDGVQTHSLEATRAELGEEVLNGHNLIAADGTVDETVVVLGIPAASTQPGSARSEEHTSELQSRGQLVCRLLLEKTTRI